MIEKAIVRNIIDFGFTIKSQLQSDETEMLRSILAIMIMECEDILSEVHDVGLDVPPDSNPLGNS